MSKLRGGVGNSLPHIVYRQPHLSLGVQPVALAETDCRQEVGVAGSLQRNDSDKLLNSAVKRVMEAKAEDKVGEVDT